MQEKVWDFSEELNTAYSLLDAPKTLNDVKQAISGLENIARYNGEVDSSAKNAIRTAQFTLGELYWNGHDMLAADDERAIYWYELAGENGHPFAQFWLGNAYSTGQRAPQNHQKAIYWYRKAAKSNIAWAQYHLGVYLSTGKGKGLKEAFHWMLRASQSGVLGAEIYVIGAYRHGYGVAMDISAADALEEKIMSSRALEMTSSAETALLLGKELLSGAALHINRNRGIELLSQPILYDNIEANIQICEACRDWPGGAVYKSQAIERLAHLAATNRRAKNYLLLMKIREK